jgi:UDP-sulfoquinovose synthase
VRCIQIALENPPTRGEKVKVFNQVTETHRLRELAEMISKFTGVDIAYLPNPRREAAENDLNVSREQFLALGLNPTKLSEGLLEEARDIAMRYKDRADTTKIIARSVWRAGMETSPDLVKG